MGAGKTTAGRRLAKELGVEFVDLDRELEQRQGQSIQELFQTKGEAGFRKLEQETLQAYLEVPRGCVVATGGGTPCHGDAMARMRSTGYTVYLYVQTEQLCKRLAKSKVRRPLIDSLNREELERYITQTLEDREPVYRQAHVTVDARALRADTLMQILEMAQ